MAKPVYALVGADTFLVLQELACIGRELPADSQRVDFDGETAELAEVLDELRSFAMFGGGGKLVVIRNADAFVTKYRQQLEDYVAEPSSSGTLVMRLNSLPGNQKIHKLIAKTGKIVPCEPPKDLARWAIERSKSEHKVTLALDAAKLLVELIGDDLGRLDMEIGKLAINAPGGKITTEVVGTNVAFTREREIFDLTNALAVGNVTEALRRWRQLLDTDRSAEFVAFSILGKWLEDVALVVKFGPNAAKRLFWKYKEELPKFIASSQALGADGYARALDLLTEIEMQSKTGVGDAAENVERFILALAPQTTR